jgi:hypothetical protein
MSVLTRATRHNIPEDTILHERYSYVTFYNEECRVLTVDLRIVEENEKGMMQYLGGGGIIGPPCHGGDISRTTHSSRLGDGSMVGGLSL